MIELIQYCAQYFDWKMKTHLTNARESKQDKNCELGVTFLVDKCNILWRTNKKSHGQNIGLNELLLQIY